MFSRENEIRWERLHPELTGSYLRPAAMGAVAHKYFGLGNAKEHAAL